MQDEVVAGSIVPLCRADLSETAHHRLRDTINSGWIGYGPVCKALEARFAARGGAALATVNCTAALYLAGRLCASDERRQVIVPAMTFVSTAAAFTSAGLQVTLADVDQTTGLIDVASVESLISENTCAVVGVHLYGQRAPVHELRGLCDAAGIALIEDCAHRVDLLDGVPPVGDLACYSFNAVKEAPGGEAGLLWMSDSSLLLRAQAMSNVGLTTDTITRSSSVSHLDYGFGLDMGLKLRSNDVNATLVMDALDVLPETRRLRRAFFEALDIAASDGSGMVMPLSRQADDSCLMYVIKVDAGLREGLRARLAKCGIATSVHYPSLSRHPFYRRDRAPRAEEMDCQLVTLPCFAAMRPEELERVKGALREL